MLSNLERRLWRQSVSYPITPRDSQSTNFHPLRIEWLWLPRLNGKRVGLTHDQGWRCLKTRVSYFDAESSVSIGFKPSAPLRLFPCVCCSHVLIGPFVCYRYYVFVDPLLVGMLYST